MQDFQLAKAQLGQEPVLSVIIVSYNTCRMTLSAVQSVLDQAAEISLEVIVVDNDSKDGTVDFLRECFPDMTNIKIIANQHNGGYAYGNNIGIAHSRGRYVLVLNPDAEIRAGALSKAVTYLDTAPEVGVLGCRVRYEDGTQQSTLFRYPTLRQLIFGLFVPNRLTRRVAWLGDPRYASLSRDKIQDVEVVAGCFMMVPRHVIDAVGQMNDRFFMYSEESEWCWRIAKAGWRIRYHPDIEILHHGAASTGHISPWKSVEIAKGQILFLRFTRGPTVAWAGALILLMGDLLKAVYFVALVPVKGRTHAAPWFARLSFLTGALIRPPRGQITPPFQSGDVSCVTT